MKTDIKKIGAVSTAAALVAGSVVAMPMMQAFADATVTINANEGENGATFTGYQIFTGTVTADTPPDNAAEKGKGKISEPRFATGMQQAFVDAYAAFADADGDVSAADELKTKFDNEAAKGTTANQAYLGSLGVQIIEKLMVASSDAPVAKSFGYYLAQQASEVTGATTATLEADKASAELAQGYWLFVAKDAPTIADEEGTQYETAATGAIFLSVGNTAVTVDQKKGLPTLTKKVQNDGTTEWGTEADQTVGEILKYQITGTFPTDYNAYETYKYVITDQPVGVSIKQGTVQVKLSGSETPIANAPVTFDADGNMKIEWIDIKEVNPDGKDVIVTYDAEVTAASAADKENTAQLEYSNKPGQDGTGHTVPSKTTVENYVFSIHKVDKGHGNLTGAKFTVKEAGADGQYVEIVNGKAQLTDEAVEIEVNDSGIITIDGLDSGDYVVTETQAPSGGYNAIMESFTVTLGDSGASVPTYGNTSLLEGKVVKATAEGETNTIDVINTTGLQLPVTGQQGFMILTIAGGIVLVVSLAGVVLRKRKQNAEDAE